ncbi:hypothetical protein Gohar_009232 [Gossypium harknessii]|uniref:Uncharacterized protein n=1 Tax=Gossypium harknessii TaxID=34285 RepID=A0A7J9GM66_9ROSI|nr:hypothetical protein [Gossypium harknessii]
MRNVCAVERQWVMPILEKLDKLDVRKLSGGGLGHVEEITEGNTSDLLKKEAVIVTAPEEQESKIQAARERFLARKGKK